MLKIFHFDEETTGDDHKRNAIHQLAGCIEVDGVIKEEFDFRVAPYPTAEITQEALDIGKVSLAEIRLYADGLTIIRQLCNLIERHIDTSNYNDKLFLAAYGGAHFDSPFLKEFFIQNGCGKFKTYFWSTVIDPMVLAANALRYERTNMQNFKLETVAKRFNIDVDIAQLHNAAYDWKISRLLLHTINKNT